MGVATIDAVKEPVRAVARTTAGLDLLLLFGSRASGGARRESDWDFGFLSASGVDEDRLLARLVEAVGDDRVDLADLGRAGGLLRYRAARDGRLLYEHRAGVFHEFRLEAVRFWCDAEPVLRRGYRAVLARMAG